MSFLFLVFIFFHLYEKTIRIWFHATYIMSDTGRQRQQWLGSYKHSLSTCVHWAKPTITSDYNMRFCAWRVCGYPLTFPSRVIPRVNPHQPAIPLTTVSDYPQSSMHQNDTVPKHTSARTSMHVIDPMKKFSMVTTHVYRDKSSPEK